MDLDFTSDQDELRDSIRAVLAKESPITVARQVAEHGTGEARVWEVVTQLGWPALTIPEDLGGIGLGAIEAGILAEELGRVVAPTPLLVTVAGFVPLVRDLGTADQRARWLPSVAAGAARATVAREGGVHARVDGDSLTLHGRARSVIEGATADVVAMCVTTDRGPAVVVLDAEQVAAAPITSVDATRGLAHLDVDGVVVPDDRVLGGVDAVGANDDAIDRALDHGTCALALEAVGACQSIFDIALAYAHERKQFGVPIGSFQAIKHKFADLAIALERARATGYFAALCLAEGDERAAITTSVAKAAAGDCQRRMGKEGIQILGGIGYTWEHDMHLYVKRAKADELLFGGTGRHRARIADLLGV